jgi:hypothetical protein
MSSCFDGCCWCWCWCWSLNNRRLWAQSIWLSEICLRHILLAESVVLGHAAVPWGVVHGHVWSQLIPLLRPLLRVLPSVMEPNSTFRTEMKRTFRTQSSLNSEHSDGRGYNSERWKTNIVAAAFNVQQMYEQSHITTRWLTNACLLMQWWTEDYQEHQSDQPHNPKRHHAAALSHLTCVRFVLTVSLLSPTSLHLRAYVCAYIEARARQRQLGTQLASQRHRRFWL